MQSSSMNLPKLLYSENYNLASAPVQNFSRFLTSLLYFKQSVIRLVQHIDNKRHIFCFKCFWRIDIFFEFLWTEAKDDRQRRLHCHAGMPRRPRWEGLRKWAQPLDDIDPKEERAFVNWGFPIFWRELISGIGLAAWLMVSNYRFLGLHVQVSWPDQHRTCPSLPRNLLCRCVR